MGFCVDADGWPIFDRENLATLSTSFSFCCKASGHFLLMYSSFFRYISLSQFGCLVFQACTFTVFFFAIYLLAAQLFCLFNGQTRIEYLLVSIFHEFSYLFSGCSCLSTWSVRQPKACARHSLVSNRRISIRAFPSSLRWHQFRQPWYWTRIRKGYLVSYIYRT